MKAKARKIDEIVPALEHGYACPHRESCRKKIIEQINLTKINGHTNALTSGHIFTKMCKRKLCAVSISMDEIYAQISNNVVSLVQHERRKRR